MLFFAFVVCRLVLGYFALFVSDLSHSESELHSVYFFGFLTFLTKVLKNFEIFSQPDGPVGKSNQSVHWVIFAGTTVWVLCFFCVRSWSFGVGIALHLFFFWIIDSVRKF